MISTLFRLFLLLSHPWLALFPGRWHVKVLGVSSSGPKIGVCQPQNPIENSGVERPPWLLSWDSAGGIQVGRCWAAG